MRGGGVRVGEGGGRKPTDLGGVRRKKGQVDQRGGRGDHEPGLKLLRSPEVNWRRLQGKENVELRGVKGTPRRKDESLALQGRRL